MVTFAEALGKVRCQITPWSSGNQVVSCAGTVACACDSANGGDLELEANRSAVANSYLDTPMHICELTNLLVA